MVHILYRFSVKVFVSYCQVALNLLVDQDVPVCVTDQTYMDKALAYAERDDVIIATFGDMLKVPGSYSSLSEAQTKGAHIHVIYTPLEVEL